MTRLVIFGAGGQGAVVAEAAVLSEKWSSVCFLEDKPDADTTVVGCPVIGTTALLSELIDDENSFLVAIGNNRGRELAIASILEQGGSLATVVHPEAIVSRSASIESGSVICACAVVNARSRIGSGTIVNTSATIDHDCILGNSVHVSPGAHLAGGVSVGDRSWIGIGAVAKEGVAVGEDCIVGAGAAVVDDVRSGITVLGVPARPRSESC